MKLLLGILAAALMYGQTDWPVYGHDPGGSRYSPLRQITVENVKSLERAWTYHTGEKPAALGTRGQSRQVAFETTPLVVGGVVYLTTPANKVIALDPVSGKEIWKFDPQAKTESTVQYHANRGVSYWPGDSKDGPRILLGTFDGRLIALNARTGQPVPGFGNEGEIDLRKGVADDFPRSTYAITSAPGIYEDLVITGAEVPESPGQGPRGDVRAWDVRSGKRVWTFHTVPQSGEPGHETWDSNGWQKRTGANVWTGFTIDTKTGTVFLAIGSTAYDFYGGDRKGADLYGDSVVALNARTGVRRWSYQLVHHDIWDYDPPAPPALVTVRRDGNEIPAVVEVTKMGLVFILDRKNGKPVFPVEERPVPKSDVPGEASWPTQPIPVKPPALSRSSMTAADLTNVTPESHQFCADLFSKLHNDGRYTPYGTKPTVVFPGTLGGATWSGVSYDPKLGYVFVNTNEVGAIGHMVKQPEGAAVAWRRSSPYGEYARFWDQNLWPCQKPPWGFLTAVNVNTGEFAWRVPLGVVPELEARGVHQTGALNIGGSIATAGGLVFIGATDDERFRAFDSRTGKELWSSTIDGSGHATPITYLAKNGRQYVVIAAGGGGYFGSKPADTVVAFALPARSADTIKNGPPNRGRPDTREFPSR
ncbi:MAG TPA: pyrroloquinoline quinone-dependent dehydrogenase [Bryobacteraceae bacterium]|nr:pyrroloquinoline quinone-dependent dehydrogenase [Bryobacteraceae bacterium]